MPKPTKHLPTGRPKAPRSASGRVDAPPRSGRPFKCIVFGESGTGKTTFWGTFPGKTLVLLCSGGDSPSELDSIAEDRIGTEVFPKVISDIYDMEKLLEDLGGYDNVVLDHASGFQMLALKELLGLKTMPKQRSWGLADKQQWGQVNVICNTFFGRLTELPKNVVIVAHERDFGEDEDPGSDKRLQPHVSVGLTPGCSGFLRGSFSYILNTFIRQKTRVVEKKHPKTGKVVGRKEVVSEHEVEFCMRVGPNGTYYTKFRRAVREGQPDLPPWIVNPTYAKVKALL